MVRTFSSTSKSIIIHFCRVNDKMDVQRLKFRIVFYFNFCPSVIHSMRTYLGVQDSKHNNSTNTPPMVSHFPRICCSSLAKGNPDMGVPLPKSKQGTSGHRDFLSPVKTNMYVLLAKMYRFYCL